MSATELQAKIIAHLMQFKYPKAKLLRIWNEVKPKWN